MPNVDFHGIPAVEVRNGAGRAVVSASGGRLLDWTVNGRKGLYFSESTGLKRTTHPCGPVFSLPDRERDGIVTKDGAYVLEGKVYTLSQHGLLRDLEWEVGDYSDSIEMDVVRPVLSSQFEENYPFPFRAQIYADISIENRLEGSLIFRRLERANESAPNGAPVNLAWHTYHDFVPGMRIEGLQQLNYRDETRHPLQPTAKFIGGPMMPEARDWHFLGLAKRNVFKLVYPDGRKIKVTLGDTATQVVIWTNPGLGNFLCFEPVLRDRNTFATKEGLWLRPGESITLLFVLEMLE